MTDDFHLFEDPHDGNGPVDPDVALITAYLARELSPMQVLALEERLATDAEFRSEMQPLIDAWAAPVPALEAGLARRVAPLSSLERAESWRRFQSEELPAASTKATELDEPPRKTTRRVSMKRIALLAGAIALPMVSFAQAVVYAANHATFPGHAVARSIVSAFTHGAAATTHAESSTPRFPANHSTSIADAPEARPLSAAKVVASESAKAAAPAVAPTPTTAPTLVARRSSIPNRALIADLTRQNQPGVVRGDTSADYVVMVLDAADNYVWSTAGGGSVSIEVGGDPRPAGERAAYVASFRDEFWGDPAKVESWIVGRAGRGAANGGFGAGLGGRGRGRSGAMSPDSTPGVAGRGGRGGLVTSRLTAGDTIYTLQYDSLIVRIAGGRGLVARGVVSLDSVGRGFGGRGRGIIAARTSATPTGSYWVGWGANAAGNMNHASGLESRSDAKSGVRGLESSSVESADTYFFAPRELAPSNLRVMVVHLTPSATWRGPS